MGKILFITDVDYFESASKINNYIFYQIPKIKAEMASMQIANSLLNDLDITPTVSASSQIQVSSLK